MDNSVPLNNEFNIVGESDEDVGGCLRSFLGQRGDEEFLGALLDVERGSFFGSWCQCQVCE